MQLLVKLFDPLAGLPVVDSDISVTSVSELFLAFQQRACECFSLLDHGQEFVRDEWRRPDGGGGISRVLSGQVFDRVGVNYSHVLGANLPSAASQRRPELAGRSFEAMGVSIVAHPSNPFVPTTHCNVRLFVAKKAGEPPVWWFGGGFDLTPTYGFIEDAKYWHQTADAACAPFGADVYPRFKRWCDEYFFLPHRNEARGVGGLFFDDLNEWGFSRCFDFVEGIAAHFLLGYRPIVEKRIATPYIASQKSFQLYRRGRYVEFNLLYDRGTLFGLQSGGRTESILMSLPPLVKWEYDWRPTPNSAESRLVSQFLTPRDWLDYQDSGLERLD